jgi:geranylgeranyl diphosphate synthase type II
MKPYPETTFSRSHFDQKLKDSFSMLMTAAHLDAKTSLKRSDLIQSMEYSLFSNGKRIRPQLVYEASHALGLSTALADPIAITVEMIHAFSLIHDDLPCMDNDDYRRGALTNHKVFGEPIALLAGDALLVHALGLFSSLATKANPDSFARAFQLLICSLGVDGIMGGQAAEIEAENQVSALTLENLLEIQHQKTTALFNACILIPVILSGHLPHTEKFQQYQKFSKAFGFAFQAADDVADAHQDQNQKNKNLLSHYSEDELRQIAKNALLKQPLLSSFPAAQWLMSQLSDAHRN